MRKLFAISCLIVMLALVACGNEVPVNTRIEDRNTDTEVSEPEKSEPGQAEAKQSESENEKSEYPLISTDPVEPEQEEQDLEFVDAWGERFVMTVNPRVKKHTYKWDCLKNNHVEISYTGDENYTIQKGIDVSYHQGEINWEKVKAAGYDFVFIRIGYRGYGEQGTLNVDSQFASYIKGAREAGLDVGVYLFSQAVNKKEALEEAELVIRELSGYELQLPVVFDPELIRDDTARTDEVTGSQFTKNTIAFCERIKEAGYEPMIYSNMYWEAFIFDLEQLSDYEIWYADYEFIPQTPYHFRFWQYTEKGIVEGISGEVDLDVRFCPQ